MSTVMAGAVVASVPPTVVSMMPWSSSPSLEFWNYLEEAGVGDGRASLPGCFVKSSTLGYDCVDVKIRVRDGKERLTMENRLVTYRRGGPCAKGIGATDKMDWHPGVTSRTCRAQPRTSRNRP